MKRKIFSVVLALVLVLSFSLVTVVPVGAQSADGDVTIVVQDQAGSPIEGATARLLFYGGGKGGYSMNGKITDASGSATFTAAEIATWLTGEGYDEEIQIYIQPGAKVETDTTYGKVRTVDPEDGFPCIPYNTPDTTLVPKSAMSFTYKMIMMSTEPVQTVWDDTSNDFTVTATLAGSLSVTPDTARMRLIRNLVGGQPPAEGGSEDDWYMWNGTAYERWIGIATVDATATGASISASFSQDILADWLVGNKIVVKPEFGVSRTVTQETASIPCVDDYYAVDIMRPSSYIHPAQINDTTLFYPTIQDAIDTATTGDTISVAAGTYTEHITIDKSNLSLIGEDRETTIVDARQDSSWDYPKPGVLINGVSGVTVSGFTIRDAEFDENGDSFEPLYGPGQQAKAGILIYGTSSNHTVDDNILINNCWGVFVCAETITTTECRNNRIANNIIRDSVQDGVYLYTDGVVPIENTQIVDNEMDNLYGEYASGVEFWACPETEPYNLAITGTVISGNNITSCTYGVRIRDDVSDITGTLVNFNNFVDNTNYGIYNGVVLTIDATRNWWGNASGPYHATTNPGVAGYRGDTVSANVTYAPWLYFTTAANGGDTLANIVANQVPAYAQAVDLTTGWNTFSVPIALDGQYNTWAKLYTLTNLPYTMAYRFDPTSQTFVGLATTSTYAIAPGEGFYVKMTAASSIPYCYSTLFSIPSRALGDGWDFIGGGLATRTEIASCTSIVTAGGTAGYSHIVSPAENAASWVYIAGALTAGDFLAGEGYWVFLPIERTLGLFDPTPVAWVP